MNKSTKPATTPEGWMVGSTYCNASARTCPKCGKETAFRAGEDEHTEQALRLGFKCTDEGEGGCNARWTRLYRLAGYDRARQTETLDALVLADREAAADASP